mgnify:CR=1 FL=1
MERKSTAPVGGEGCVLIRGDVPTVHSWNIAGRPTTRCCVTPSCRSFLHKSIKACHLDSRAAVSATSDLASWRRCPAIVRPHRPKQMRLHLPHHVHACVSHTQHACHYNCRTGLCGLWIRGKEMRASAAAWSSAFLPSCLRQKSLKFRLRQVNRNISPSCREEHFGVAPWFAQTPLIQGLNR